MLKFAILFGYLALGVFSEENGEITSLEELNDAAKRQSITLGVLSEANFNSIKYELADNIQPKVFEDSDQLYKAVSDGTVDAGLMSGADSTRIFDFHVFPSSGVTLHAMLFKDGDEEVQKAVNAAIVRVIQEGQFNSINEENMPYDPFPVHSCAVDPSDVPFPPGVFSCDNRGPLKIATLPNVDWNSAGNYTLDSVKDEDNIDRSTGFWPDFEKHVEEQFEKEYGCGFETVWTDGIYDAIQSGEADSTSPYMLVGAGKASLSSNSALGLSCITAGNRSVYFTKKSYSDSKK